MKERETKTQNKKGTSVLKVVFNTFINILIVVVLVVSLLIAVLALTSKSSGISTIFGYTIQVVQTDSMKGGSEDYEGGDFETGDIIIGKATNSDPDATYNVGDIVTYLGTLSGTDEKGLITHRIVEEGKFGANDDTTVYRTKGDNNFDADQAAGDTFYYVPAKDIKSLFYSNDYHGSVIKGWGKVLQFVQSQMGFFLVVLLPMIIFFIYELVRVVMNAAALKNEKAKEEMEESEDERKAAIDAAVAAALAEKEKETAGATETKPEADGAPGMTAEEMEQFRQFQEFQKMQKAAKAKEEEPKEEKTDAPEEK